MHHRTAVELVVSKVRAAINVRFPSDQPTILFTDRGEGFFDPRTGTITPEYKQAARNHGFKVFQGDNAANQPGQANLGQLLLHETAVAWIRYRLARTLPAEPWNETVEQYGTRLRGIVADINDNLDVDGLCRAFPTRIQKVIDREGDNIPH